MQHIQPVPAANAPLPSSAPPSLPSQLSAQQGDAASSQSSSSSSATAAPSSPSFAGDIPYGHVRRGPYSASRAASGGDAAASSGSPPSTRYLVLALGGSSLRYGSVEDFVPRVKAMAIAYRVRETTEQEDVKMTEEDKREEKKEEKKEESREAETEDQEEEQRWHEAARASFERLNADVIKRRIKPPPKPKFFDEYDSIPVYEEGGPTTSVTLAVDDTGWTDTSQRPSFMTGNAALRLHPREPYSVYFPIRYGHLNVVYAAASSPAACSPPGCASTTSYTACLSALEDIICDTLASDLHIPLSSLSSYSVSLSLPATFTAREVFDVCSILLSRMRVQQLFVHTEAVLATYGAGLPYACVVDIGSQSVRVCCVDDGAVLAGSEVQGDYGGDDLSELLLEWLRCHDHYMPCRDWQLRRRAGDGLSALWRWRQVQEMKEKVLLCALREFNYQWLELRELEEGGKGVRVHRMNVSSAAVIAPRALFEPNMLRDRAQAASRGAGRDAGQAGSESAAAAPRWHNSSVFDVVMDDIVRGSVFFAFTREYERAKDRLPKREAWEQVRKQAAQAADSSAAVATAASATASAAEATAAEEQKDDLLPLLDGRRRKRKKEETPALPPAKPQSIDFTLPASSSASRLGLARLIAASINSLQSVPHRRRMCLSILLTGAVSAVPGFAEYASLMLSSGLPTLMGSALTWGRQVGEEVQCVLGGKLVPVGCESWKGAAVMAGIRVENLGSGGRDRWIAREDWDRAPARVLRERCPFPLW